MTGGHWQFSKGDAVPNELFETENCRATFACDVVIYDDASGLRQVIGNGEPMVFIEAVPPGADVLFRPRKLTLFCVDHKRPVAN